MKARSLKLVLAASCLIALTMAVSPKIIGLGIERITIDNMLALILAEADSQLEIRRNTFRKGWFSSTAEIEVIYTPLGAEAISLLMNFDIDHGPLLQTLNGPGFGLAYADISADIHSELFDPIIAGLPFPPPEVNLDLFVRFNQSVQLGMAVSSVTYSGADGEMRFEGLDASLLVAQDQSAKFTMNMGKLNAAESSANSNFAISGISLHGETAQMNDILAESNAELSIPSISSTAPLPFVVADILVGHSLLKSPDSAQQLEAYQVLNVGGISGDLPLRSLSWSSEVKQVNGELVRQYYQLLNELQNEMNTEPTAVSAELTEPGQELLLLTLQNRLEVNNFIKANAFDGDHNTELRLQWAGLSELDNVAALDIDAALAALTIDLNVSLDLEAILRSPMAEMVAPYTQQGYLTLDNGRLLLQASLRESVLHVNGDEIPLDQFFQAPHLKPGRTGKIE